jgi:hypothetical protein
MTTLTKGHRGGTTYEADFDFTRLNTQAQNVFDLMSDGKLRSLADIAYETGYGEASVSARLRDFRKEKFGNHEVKRYRDTSGLFLYQLVINKGFK